MFNMYFVLGFLRMIIFILVLFIVQDDIVYFGCLFGVRYGKGCFFGYCFLVNGRYIFVLFIIIFNSIQIMQIDRFIRVFDGFCIVERIYIYVEKNKKKGVVLIIILLVIILFCYFLVFDKVCIVKKKKIFDFIINNICWK